MNSPTFKIHVYQRLLNNQKTVKRGTRVDLFYDYSFPSQFNSIQQVREEVKSLVSDAVEVIVTDSMGTVYRIL